MNLVVRTRSEPDKMTTTLRDEIRAADASPAVFNVRPLAGMLSDSIAERRFNVVLILSFSLVAVLTAAVGLYGLMTYLVTQQAADIGIRMSLGARRHDVLRLVLGHGIKLTGAGIGAGLLVAALVTRLIASLLFGVSALDPAAFGGVAVFLASVSIVACWVPALKASRLDALTVIRQN
jgi:ABC-type antimicrobial peptide transport system permease subunit